MAQSGTINFTTNNANLIGKVEWSTSQNVASGYTTVTASLYYRRTDSYTTYGTGNFSMYVELSSVSPKSYTSVNKYVEIKNSWVQVMQIQKVFGGRDQIRISIDVYSGSGIPGTSFLRSDFTETNIWLNAIPWSSRITLNTSNPDIGDQITISIDRDSSELVNTLRYTAYGSTTASGVIATNVTGASQNWTVPTSFYNLIPNDATIRIVVTCESYSGSTLLGSTTASLTASVPTSNVPTISSISIQDDDSAIASKFSAYLQNQTYLKVAISASPSTGSTVSSYQTWIQGVSYSGNSFTSDLIVTSGNIGVAVVVTDSRGRTTTQTNTIYIEPYASPSITSFKAERTNQDGTVNDDGLYMKATFNFSITPVNNRNDKSYVIEYKDNSTGTWATLTSGSIYSANTSFVSASAILNADHSYHVRITVEDYFSSVVATYDVPSAFTLMDFRSTGRGMGIGKVSEKDRLEIDMATDFTGDVRIYAPTSTVADGAFVRLNRSNGTLLAFVATSDNGTGLNIHLYDGSSWSGMLKINENGDIYTTGSIHADGTITGSNINS